MGDFIRLWRKILANYGGHKKISLAALNESIMTTQEISDDYGLSQNSARENCYVFHFYLIKKWHVIYKYFVKKSFDQLKECHIGVFKLIRP